MNRYQKLAWFNLIVIVVTIIVTSTVTAIELRTRGYSTIGPCFVLIMVLMRLNPFLFKKPQGQNSVICDERDSLIVKRALAVACKAFWIVLVLSSFSLFFLLGLRSSVPTITLSLMALGGGLFMKTVCSVAILVQYNSGGKSNE